MRARSKVYHIECFRCVACSRQLIPGDEFALREDGLFCRADHDVVERASLGAGDPLSPLHPARPLQMAGTPCPEGGRRGEAGSGLGQRRPQPARRLPTSATLAATGQSLRSGRQFKEVFWGQFAQRFALLRKVQCFHCVPWLTAPAPPLARPVQHTYAAVCLYMGTHKCTPLALTCTHTSKQYFQFTLASKPRLTENGLQLSARYSSCRCLIKGVELWALELLPLTQ